MEMFQSSLHSKQVMESANSARQFIKKRPKTCLFMGALFVSGCVPVAIFLAVVLGFLFFLLTCLLVIEGTVIGLSLTTLLFFLSGPLCFASFCTLVAYIVQRLWLILEPACKTTVGNLFARIKIFPSKFVPNVPHFPDHVMAFINNRELWLANDEGAHDMNESFSTDDGFNMEDDTTFKAKKGNNMETSGEKISKPRDKAFFGSPKSNRKSTNC